MDQRLLPVKLPWFMLERGKKPEREKVIEDMGDRNWNVVQNTFGENCKVEMILHTRRETFLEIPTKLYSSPKYDLKQVISGFPQDDFVLMGILKVVNPETNEEIFNNKNERILVGTLDEVFQTNLNDKSAEFTFKFQDVSFNHERKNFCLLLE
jgi:hypothetical protein